MKNRSRRAGGFSLMVVVGTIAFAAAAMVVLSSNFVSEARRTRACVEAAQIRQLLLAGAVHAADDLNRAGLSEGFATTMNISIGSASDAASVRIVVKRDSPDANLFDADITAALGKSTARQRVTFEHGKAGWVIVDAELR